ncbi:MAG: DMT family transporter [Mycobacteriales bacterium]
MTGEAAPTTIVVTLAAAGCFAGAVVLQQRVAAAQGANIGLLAQPVWMAGITLDFVGFVLQVVALHLGTLTLVQPLLTTTLLFALAFGRSRLGRLEWTGAATLAVGLSGFLAAAAPRGGGGIDEPRLALAAAIALALGGIAWLWGQVVVLAAAASICFALVAGLAKAAGNQLTAHGVLSPLTHWDVYALAVSSILGLTLEQKAFAAGALVPSLITLTLGDPLMSLCLGVLVEGEALRGGPPVFAAVFAAGLAVTGVVLLARSPIVQAERVP